MDAPDSEIAIDVESRTSMKPQIMEMVIKYVEEHNGGYKITRKSDLRVNTISTKNFAFALTNTPKDADLILISSDNPIFKIMNSQEGAAWQKREWIYGQYFQVNRVDENEVINTTSSQMRFGLTANLNPFSFIGTILSKNFDNLIAAVSQPHEYMLYLVSEEAFESVCDSLYKEMLHTTKVEDKH